MKSRNITIYVGIEMLATFLAATIAAYGSHLCKTVDHNYSPYTDITLALIFGVFALKFMKQLYKALEVLPTGRVSWTVLTMVPIVMLWSTMAFAYTFAAFVVCASVGVGLVVLSMEKRRKQMMVGSNKATYMVGGAVRDRLMGFKPKDVDYVVTGHTEQDMISRGMTKVGAKFPVYLDSDGNEWALARTEKSTGPGYNDFEVDFNPNVTIEEDLYRRDFTINAIAFGIGGMFDGIHIDPYGGLDDIKNRVIRPVNPDAFRDDPVRIFRAARFAARYDFELHESVRIQSDICIRNGGLNHIDGERIRLEFEKAVDDARFSEFLKNLPDGVLSHIGLASLAGNRYYISDLMERVDGYDYNIVIPAMTIGLDEPSFNKLVKTMKLQSLTTKLAKKARKWWGVARFAELMAAENMHDMLYDLHAFHEESTCLDPVLTIYAEAFSIEYFSADTINRFINAAMMVNGTDIMTLHPDAEGKEIRRLLREYRVKRIQDEMDRATA